MSACKTASAVVLGAILLSACAVSPKSFYANSAAVNDTALCRAAFETKDHAFRTDVIAELQRRGITSKDCEQKILTQEVVAAGALLAATTAAVAVACSSYSCAGGGGGGYSAGADWDQFYDGYGNLVWHCRERATGHFTANSNCYGSPYIDHWPGW